MGGMSLMRKLSSFQIIIAGFFSVILLGTLLLMLPISAKSGQWTPFGSALFTATSAVCVTGLVVHDTATYWSVFGQVVTLILIQIGGLGVISVAAFIFAVSGRKISLLQRVMLQDTISAHQLGGVVKLTGFIFKLVFCVELLGAVIMLPSFCGAFGIEGVWMAVFHSVSAFCNAGFDIMGGKSGEFTSLEFFQASPDVVFPICLLIIMGGIGFLTWDDMITHGRHIKKYRMQSKAIFVMTALLILVPAMFFCFNDFDGHPLKERICLSIFQAVTPRTAGFGTIAMTSMSEVGRALIIILMLIGGSPGSTAGGIKTTTVAVLAANAIAVFRRKKNAQLFSRRIEDDTIKTAATLLTLYIFLMFIVAIIISGIEKIPLEACVFESASAIGTVGLSMGITPMLGTASRLLLVTLMFFGRVGGLTLLFAAVRSYGSEISRFPVEKINVG